MISTPVLTKGKRIQTFKIILPKLQWWAWYGNRHCYAGVMGKSNQTVFRDSFEKVLEQDFNFRGKASLLTEFQAI